MIKRVSHTFELASCYEETEWLNYWIDHADKKDSRRILLIGDSTSREYRSTLAQRYGHSVDFIGLSSIFLDEFCLREIELFFEFQKIPYELIQVQIGCHQIENMAPSWDRQAFYEAYRQQYAYVMDFLKQHTKRLVLATTTPIVLLNAPSNPVIRRLYNRLHSYKNERIDPKYDTDIQIRNQIVRELAANGIGLNDLYLLMSQLHMRHVDHVHYEKKSKKVIAESVLSFLNTEKASAYNG